jgi:hypothetical protein
MKTGVTPEMKTRMRRVLTLRKMGNNWKQICAHLNISRSQYERTLEYLCKSEGTVRPEKLHDDLPRFGDFAVKPNYGAHERVKAVVSKCALVLCLALPFAASAQEMESAAVCINEREARKLGEVIQTQGGRGYERALTSTKIMCGRLFSPVPVVVGARLFEVTDPQGVTVEFFWVMLPEGKLVSWKTARGRAL